MAVAVSIDQSYKSEISKVFQLQQENTLKLRAEPVKKRLERITRIEQWVYQHKDEIRQAVFDDFRKPTEEADFSEVFPVLSEIRHVKNNLRRWVKPKKTDTPLHLLGSSSHVECEPKGVALIVAPWNYPFQLVVSPLVSALAAGNTAIVKPSEITPQTAALLAKMVNELFDEKEVALYEGGVSVSTFLLSLPFDHIFFTGSPAIGKKVMKAAAENLTSVTLELGGKSPVIVDDTADLKTTAERIAWGKLLNAGQSCVSPDYILVHHSKMDALIEKVGTQMDKLYGKDGAHYKHAMAYGRIVNETHFDRIENLIEDARKKGAKAVYAPEENDRKNCFIPPLLLKNINEDMEIAHEEIFGPVLPFIPFHSLEQAISYINNKPKPLSLYMFSSSVKNQKKVLRETSSGSVAINDCMVQFAQNNLPFGGVNNSGIGKAHGYYGFLAFSNEKSVYHQWFPVNGVKIVYPPFTRFKRQILKLLIQYF